MKKKLSILVTFLAAVAVTEFWFLALPQVSLQDLGVVSESPDSIERGEYLVVAGGCISCHRGQTEETSDTFAGGLPIETDFGTFYTPNITPDLTTGLSLINI